MKGIRREMVGLDGMMKKQLEETASLLQEQVEIMLREERDTQDD